MTAPTRVMLCALFACGLTCDQSAEVAQRPAAELPNADAFKFGPGYCEVRVEDDHVVLNFFGTVRDAKMAHFVVSARCWLFTHTRNEESACGVARVRASAFDRKLITDEDFEVNSDKWELVPAKAGVISIKHVVTRWTYSLDTRTWTVTYTTDASVAGSFACDSVPSALRDRPVFSLPATFLSVDK